MGKNKTLPKNFEDLIKEGDVDKLKAVFQKSMIDARGGYSKQTALAYNDCPDDLARWLVEQGADIHAADMYGKTPLHSRAHYVKGNLGILLDLGADVNHFDEKRHTALHIAAGAHSAGNCKQLIARGASLDVQDKDSLTPLTYALQMCSNAMIVRMLEVAQTLLDAGATKQPQINDLVTRIGTNFEFMRSGFNPDSREATSDALDSLYVLFDVVPVPKRSMHDGKSPIITKSASWQDRHKELWELLVPPRGAAPTVQGEVIRISGRISRELEDNGGGNWDDGFRQMADAWLTHVRSGIPLPLGEAEEVAELIGEIKRRNGDTDRMCELATTWVALNPTPLPLPTPQYER